MMKHLFIWLIFCAPIMVVSAQDTIVLDGDKNGTSFSIDSPKGTPSLLLPKEEEAAPRSFRSDEDQKAIMRTNDLGFPEYKVDQKFKQKSNAQKDDYKGIYRRNQYLGDLRNNGEFVKILCRDHQFVDGDLIRIKVNDVVVQSQVYLIGDYKAIKVELQSGFNKIDFEALNEGQSSPNTAELRVLDDQGNIVSSNYWFLGTGFTASIVVIKE
ncbi:hypothetical protein ACFQ1M_07190 [Sungkyunkwania multivorans]|uniref:Secreted protein n=1 Tax=Sungkyunkwania multivorans TaxID=1173618 RepID=A0ABW3CW39_9FLAO